MESLGFDKNNTISSRQVIKTGPNRGRRHPEKDGTWVYMSGHLSSERSAAITCVEWSNKLIGMSFRVGKNWSDGVSSYYLWKSN